MQNTILSNIKHIKKYSDMNYKYKHYHIQKKEYAPHIIIEMPWKENISKNRCCTWQEKIHRIFS